MGEDLGARRLSDAGVWISSTDKSKLLSALEKLKSAGYAGFETNYRSLEHSFDNSAPMRDQIEKRGLPLIGLHFGARGFRCLQRHCV